ncbi:hypothetical protein D915_010071 [Fasciola hepatica]|uniref:Lsm14-like N-terminal domain-containing protein n=1 Tax=Fasciola hepatica TaxID=6192 RepID=A0A4E0QWC3_FASHE|nr:hypothetical protein D915_010071 [Fasciola hepatica]
MSLSEISLIGCRISIISKAQIRYEGFLHSVDCDTPNEPVITLSKVWSFGTEDRPCERPVAPRNEEYNQVVFRGRDLEDVRLVQSSVFLNEDSAIVSAAPGTTPVHPSEPKREGSCSYFKSISEKRFCIKCSFSLLHRAFPTKSTLTCHIRRKIYWSVYS